MLRRLLIKVWQVKVNSPLYSTAAFGNGWLREGYLILIILIAGFVLPLLLPAAFTAVHVPVVTQALLNTSHFQEGYFWHPHDNKL